MNLVVTQIWEVEVIKYGVQLGWNGWKMGCFLESMSAPDLDVAAASKLHAGPKFNLSYLF